MVKPFEMREADFKREIEAQKYPQSIKNEFFEYWSEPNKSGTKMRFELEKTWHLGKRLARWANNGFNSIKNQNQPVVAAKKDPAKTPENDLQRLDAFLIKYASRPADMPFSEFCKWYDFMKAERLLIPLTKQQVDELLEVYNGDKGKCRCAVVQMTLDGYVKGGWTFEKTMEVRTRLC